MAEPQNKTRPPVLTIALLISGNTIGAGILALPIDTGEAGFFPSVLGMIGIWIIMFLSGWVISRAFLDSDNPNADLPTLFETTLGKLGKWTGIVGYFIVFYGLLTGYLSVGTTVLGKIEGDFSFSLPSGVNTFIFFLLVTGVVLFGMNIVSKANVVLMLLLGIAFFVIVATAGRHVRIENLQHVNFSVLPFSLPVLLAAFNYQNLVPSACKALGHDRKAVIKAILIGTGIPFVLYLVWTFVMLGVLPLDGSRWSIAESYKHDYPATISLAGILHSDAIKTAGTIFALLAVITSYIAAGYGVREFLRDLLPANLKTNRYVPTLLTFVPPLAITLVNPSLFLKAMDIVGGIGVALVFGILPGLMLITGKGKRRIPLGVCLLIAFAAILGIEVVRQFR